MMVIVGQVGVAVSFDYLLEHADELITGFVALSAEFRGSYE